jgi:spore maturation protein CgeD
MTPSVSVFMPSHNKGAFALAGIASLQAQTRTDWELWLLENSTDNGHTRSVLSEVTERDSRINFEQVNVPFKVRQEKVVPTWLLNNYYGKANGDYIFYMSDDDLISPDCFQKTAGFLDGNPGIGTCWFDLYRINVREPWETAGTPWGYIPANGVRGPDGVLNLVDGGQILHRKSCLDDIPAPWFEEDPTRAEGHWDGLFLQRLTVTHPLYPVPDPPSVTHRHTPLSMYSPS